MIIWRFPKQMLEALNTLQRVEKIGVEFTEKNKKLHVS